jgi:hypothetical protein
MQTLYLRLKLCALRTIITHPILTVWIKILNTAVSGVLLTM